MASHPFPSPGLDPVTPGALLLALTSQTFTLELCIHFGSPQYCYIVLQIAIVGVDSLPQIPRARIFDAASETIPLCTEAAIQLETFVTSFTPGAVNYAQAFNKAFSLFSNNSTIGELRDYVLYSTIARE